MTTQITSNKGKKATQGIGIFSAFLLFGLVSAFLYSPVKSSHADEKGTLAAASVEAVVSLASDEGVTLEFTPKDDGTFKSEPLDVFVTTNSPAGYKLSMSSIDEATDMTSVHSSDVIKSDFSGGVTSATMAVNKWGYSKDNTTFYKVPPLSSPAVLVDTTTSETNTPIKTTLYIGANVNNKIGAGVYQKSIKFSAIAYEPVKNIFSITTMQEMTADICSATTTPAKTAKTFDWNGSHDGDTSYVPRTQLKDTRDGNYYLVSKLADGNCWMSQSLALDLSTSKALTNSDTNLTTKTSWTPNNNTQTTTGTKWAQADNNARSYHPQASEAYYKAGTTKSSAPTGTGDEYLWEKAGNYYNWYAATAGSGTSDKTNDTVNDSICPKGWRLPMNTGTKSFINLTSTTYGLASSADGSLALRADPLNFNLSGYYHYNNAAMYYQGSNGFYWSSTAYSTATYAYDLAFNTSAISPQDYNSKGYGFSVRCVAL